MGCFLYHFLWNFMEVLLQVWVWLCRVIKAGFDVCLIRHHHPYPIACKWRPLKEYMNILLETMSSADQGCRKWLELFVTTEKHKEIWWWVLSNLELVLELFFGFKITFCGTCSVKLWVFSVSHKLHSPERSPLCFFPWNGVVIGLIWFCEHLMPVIPVPAVNRTSSVTARLHLIPWSMAVAGSGVKIYL